jgi:hypothetical protein
MVKTFLVELMTAIAIFVLVLAAIWCGQIAWYLTTPTGILYWEKMQERRRQQKIIRDWLDGL